MKKQGGFWAKIGVVLSDYDRSMPAKPIAKDFAHHSRFIVSLARFHA